MGIGMGIPKGYRYILAIDGSADSKEAERLMREAGLSFYLYRTTPEYAEARLPMVMTGLGSNYEGLHEIKGYILPDPAWPAKKAALDKRFEELGLPRLS